MEKDETETDQGSRRKGYTVSVPSCVQVANSDVEHKRVVEGCRNDQASEQKEGVRGRYEDDGVQVMLMLMRVMLMLMLMLMKEELALLAEWEADRYRVISPNITERNVSRRNRESL